MAKQTQLRRGTAAEQAAFAGAIGEISVNTTDNRLAVHNGSKLGGFPAIHENGDKGLDLTLTGNANLTAKNITLKDSSLDSSLSISSSGIRMRDSSIDRFVIDDASFYIKDNGNILIQNDRNFYNSAGQLALSLNSYNLYYTANGNVILDWDYQELYDTNNHASIGWSQRQLYNNGGSVVTLNWNDNTLYRNNNGTPQLAVNWSGCELRDKNGILSQDWNSRKLIKSDGSTEALDWENLRLMDSSTFIVVDWENKVLQNTDGNTTVDWQNHLLQFDNTTALDWASKYLYKYGGTVKTLDWENQTLNNGSSIILDWNNRILSGAWNGNYLILNNYIRANTSYTDSLVSLTDGGDTLFDMVNNVINYNGDEVLSWDNRILSGTWTIENGQFTNRPTVNGVGVLLVGEAAGTSDTSLTTGNQFISGVKTFLNLTNFSSGISGNAAVFNILGQGLVNINSPTGINILSNNGIINISGASGINLNASNNYSININTYGTGRTNFLSRPYVNNTGIVLYSDNLVYSTGSQNISGPKIFDEMPKVGSANIVVTSGNQTISGIKTFTNPIVIGTASVLLSTGNQTMFGTKTFNQLNISGGQFRVGNSQPRGAFDIKTEIPETPTLYLNQVVGAGNYTSDTNLIIYSVAAFKTINNVKYFSQFGTGSFQETPTSNQYYFDITWSAVSGADGYRIVADEDYYFSYTSSQNYYDVGNTTGILSYNNTFTPIFTFDSNINNVKPSRSGGSLYMDSAGASHIYSPTSNQLSIGYSTGSKAVLSISSGGNLDIGLSGSSSTRYIKVNNPTVFNSTLILSGNIPNASTSPGIRNTMATSGGYLYVATGTNLWGRVALSNW